MSESLAGKVCKKCGYIRKAEDQAPDYACPSCEAVYHKIEEILRKKEEEERRKQAEAINREALEQRRAQRQPPMQSAPPAAPQEPVKRSFAFNAVAGVLLALFAIGTISSNNKERNADPPQSSSASASYSRNDENQRAAQIKRLFSAWDGSLPDLERAIKNRMHDPSSYEHVSTRYTDTGSDIEVYTTYRGKNKLGAMVLSTAHATVSVSGAVQSVTY